MNALFGVVFGGVTLVMPSWWLCSWEILFFGFLELHERIPTDQWYSRSCTKHSELYKSENVRVIKDTSCQETDQNDSIITSSTNMVSAYRIFTRTLFWSITFRVSPGLRSLHHPEEAIVRSQLGIVRTINPDAIIVTVIMIYDGWFSKMRCESKQMVIHNQEHEPGSARQWEGSG